jgi:hypothetical protein
MKRVIGMDIHRTFAEVVFWEDGRLRWHGRVDMTRTGLEGFGRSLTKEDEVVVEATGNAMAVVRVLGPYVARVIVANPLQVKAIAHARIKTDKIPTPASRLAGGPGSMPASWPRSAPPTSCPRCGCPMPRPSAGAGWWPGATRSCATAPG